MSVEVGISVENMTCASCVAHVEKLARGVDGVADIRVNLARGRARLTATGDANDVARRAAAAIRGGGFPAVVDGGDVADAEAARLDRQRQHASAWGWRAVVGLLLWAPVEVTHWSMVLAGHDHGGVTWMTWLALAAGTVALLYIGPGFYRSALAGLRRGTTNMDTLIALGTSVAYGYSLVALVGHLAGWWAALPPTYFMEAAAILALISLGHWLEARARDKTGEAIRALVDLAPAEATLEDGRVVPVSTLAIGDRFVARPGDRIATDGKVIDGRSGVDEALVTGEPLPADRGPGDEVIGGTLAVDGRLVVAVTRIGADTALAQIVDLVERAQASKPPVQKLADRIAAIFVPTVLLIALLTGVGWFVYGTMTDMPGPEKWGMLAKSVCSVLIIACPCALGLAVPAAIMVGTGRGAKRGILLRHIDAIQQAGKLAVVALDKTGTVTSGQPRVVAVTGDDTLALAAAAEQFSGHPLAAAVVAHAKTRGISPDLPESFEDAPGRGVVARLNGEPLLVGSAALLAEHDVDVPADEAEPFATHVHVARGGRHVGRIALSDSIKPDTAEALATLKSLGLRLVLITGDRQAAADVVARELGLDEVHAEVRPGGKAEIVRQLQRHGPVAMVGDGVNDAPALAAADLGIAIGGGSDVAAEAGGIVLTGQSLTGVAAAIRLSRATMRVVKQNLFLAFVYNVLAIPAAAFGLLNPAIAAACMALSDVSVLGNALRLRGAKIDERNSTNRDDPVRA
jgi:Cu+-exporting ATPase